MLRVTPDSGEGVKGPQIMKMFGAPVLLFSERDSMGGMQ
jgi:hypothetical protein